jgi:hypothetical protein
MKSLSTEKPKSIETGILQAQNFETLILQSPEAKSTTPNSIFN